MIAPHRNSLLLILTAAVTLPCLSLHAAPQTKPTPKSIPQTKSPRPTKLPALGDDAPASLIQRSSGKLCETDPNHHDPCAILTLRNDRITVAWDATTHRVTYLYSTTLDTDDDIAAGDTLKIDGSGTVTPFPISSVPHRFVSSDWCDTDTAISGDQLWCAVMIPAHPRAGRVLGFVQSIYLYLPDIDAPPLHRTSTSAYRTRAAVREEQ